MEIRVDDDDIEKALRILKRKIQKDGLMAELKKRCYYEKPSVRLKNKLKESRRRNVRNTRRRLKGSKNI